MKSKSGLLVSCVLGVLGAASLLVLCGFDWPRWRGPDGNGISQETDWNPKALSEGPKVLWKVKVGMGYSNIAILNDRVYAAGGPRLTISCLDASTGNTIWKHVEEAAPPNSTPAVDVSGVYVLNTAGILVSLNTDDGSLQWKKDLVADYGGVKPYYEFSGSPVIESDLLLMTMNTSGIAVDKKTGAMIWGSEKPIENEPLWFNYNGADNSTPVIYEQNGKKYAVMCSYKGVHSVEAETGNLLWLYDWQKKTKFTQVADPIVFDRKLFLVQYAGFDLGAALFDISGTTPLILWRNQEMCSNVASPVLVDGYLYLCQDGPDAIKGAMGSLRCLDVKRGVKVWEELLDKRPISLTSAGGKLIVLSDKGTLYIAEASSKGYKEISRCDVLTGQRGGRQFWTPPVLCNGRLYCRNSWGDLTCIDVRN